MPAKLIITRGLPGCGKSTRANEYAMEHAQDESEIVRVVTMDDIRVAVGAVFELGDESIVQSIRDFTIRAYLTKGYTVISADTNLAPRTFQHVTGLANFLEAPVEVWDMTDVPLQTCLDRNAERWLNGDRKVPNQAIVKMHEKYLAKA